MHAHLVLACFLGLLGLKERTEIKHKEQVAPVAFGAMSQEERYAFLHVGKYWPDLLRIRLRGPEPQRERYTMRTFHVSQKPFSYPLRWRITQEYLWGIEAWHEGDGTLFPLTRIPMERMRRFPGDNLATRPVQANVEKPVVSEEDTPTRQKQVVRTGELSSYPRMPPLWGADVRRRFQGRMRLEFDYDLCPLAKDHCLVFLREEGKMAVWDLQEELVNQDWKIGTWTRTEVFDVPFDEGFHAWVDGDTYLFVTESGKLYASTKDEQGKRTTELRWPGDEKPLRAMLLDSDREKAYVFGRNFFFELTAGEPQPIPCLDITHGRDDIEEPLRTVYECAKALMERRSGQP